MPSASLLKARKRPRALPDENSSVGDVLAAGDRDEGDSHPGKVPKSPDERKVLPMALYRVQRPNATWPSVPGDVVQVSPLMETIAYTSSGSFIQVYDPFIYFESGSATPTAPLQMYLLDTQPAVRGALYRYLLVLFDPVTREIAEILVTNDVQL
jgi:hypothetical protein